MHHFCYPCLIKWCKYKTSCPICRQTIFEIKFDKELDIFLNGEDNCTLFKYPNENFITFPKDTNPGITIKNNNGPGVKIVSVKSDGQFYIGGFRKGHVILFINNVPCNNHIMTIDIINNAYQNSVTLIINTLTSIK